MYNINILAIFDFRFLINSNIFLVVEPLGGVPPPKPLCSPGVAEGPVRFRAQGARPPGPPLRASAHGPNGEGI